MPKLSIRKDDQVKVLIGKDAGTQGRVLSVMAERNRAIVEGVNKIKRHTRPNPTRNVKGGVVEREASVHVSNLMIVCPECSKPTRVKRLRGEDGRGKRQCKKCGGSLDRASKE